MGVISKNNTFSTLLPAHGLPDIAYIADCLSILLQDINLSLFCQRKIITKKNRNNPKKFHHYLHSSIIHHRMTLQYSSIPIKLSLKPNHIPASPMLFKNQSKVGIFYSGTADFFFFFPYFSSI
mmetsp:Transcript_4528/g.8813  ORF Transcript_4528/g.8813 Transcript_4528/m.8813 type:complete len:123 (+) Transcript_4528:45-413(+)